MRPLQSASIANKKDHWDVGRSSGHVWWWAWGLPYLGAGRRLRPHVVIPACVSTHALRWRRPGRCLPFHVPIWPRRQLFVQRCPMGVGGDSPAHCLGADRPLRFPGRAPPVASCPGHFVMFHACHCPLCRSIDGVPASAGNSVGTGPHQRSNSDRACKRYVLSRNRVSIETRKLHIILDPGMRFPEN